MSKQNFAFKYNNIWFEPVGNIQGGWYVKTNCMSDYVYNFGRYDYKEFYKKAKKFNCSVDVFSVNGVYVMPCYNGFRQVINTSKIKDIYRYTNYALPKLSVIFNDNDIDIVVYKDDVYTCNYEIGYIAGNNFYYNVKINIPDNKLKLGLKEFCNKNINIIKTFCEIER